ncbi:riboflavin synthase [Stackebrandtia nassauensis]|uniref:Riboflavin synthase n=1 Tax=Stackebrandtia nassauensis (strain DSM 44728 / CIP 108903 / NRRL B-16338 / NBRC 102104 / LLR-40K-21) TaxID=446470 RepID=D3Q6A1_STANL|nr:riboflavin synthase [Stackebrandtia nassauensis]ADD42276.1 riboflavin synthase, alpha subunit [Stackebrandtia nassauensis DSM 44728]
MFTGIVEELGEIVATAPASLSIRGKLITSDAHHGDSIAVNGVCLTVTAVTDDVFTVDVMGETYKRTALDTLKPGDQVNLERAATLSTRMGGHLVQGHVDAVGEILRREPEAEWETVTFRVPEALTKYIVEKGSITIDGVSLTVVAVKGEEFSVGLIPTTMQLTTLGRKRPGDPVHIETDIIAKHVEKLLEAKS